MANCDTHMYIGEIVGTHYHVKRTNEELHRLLIPLNLGN